jgi:hypothetical protein
VGGRADGGEDAYRLFQDETLAADDQAFWMKVRDVTKATLTETTFHNILGHMQQSADAKITSPVAAVEVLSNRFNLPESETNSILNNLINDGDMSVWGLANAVTLTAHNLPELTYERASDLEILGGNLMTMPEEWKPLINADMSTLKRRLVANKN